MSRVDLVRLDGKPVAVVADGEARITAGLDEQAEATVKGMCLFAMEVQAGVVDGPYTDARALRYAQLANRQRAAAAEPGRLAR